MAFYLESYDAIGNDFVIAHSGNHRNINIEAHNKWVNYSQIIEHHLIITSSYRYMAPCSEIEDMTEDILMY